MKPHEFFAAYANVPLSDRDAQIKVWAISMTLSDIYMRIKAAEDMMRPVCIERDQLIRAAEEFIKSHQA